VSPSQLRGRVLAERIAWVRTMLEAIRTLPLDTLEQFHSDRRNMAAAESYLRRALEALFDLGRHILAKGFGEAVIEYKGIGQGLVRRGVLSEKEGELFRTLAGYRNRMVHFYQEVSEPELYEVCSRRLGDIEAMLKTFLRWVEAHPEKVDHSL